MPSNKICFFVLGRPGSGKDTQADFLADHFDLILIETSRLLREKFAAADPSDETINKEKKLFDSGLLNASGWVISVIKEKANFLVENDFLGKKGLIFSGSPRTLKEAKDLTSFIFKHFDHWYFKAIILNVDRDIAIARIIKRAVRPLDLDPETLEARMDEYEDRTLPVLDYLKSRDLVIEVDGNPSPARVWQAILSKLFESARYRDFVSARHKVDFNSQK